MAIEVHRATETWGTGGWAWWSTGLLWHFAQAIAASSSWRIIDSYMANANPGPARTKGDPITGGEWASNGSADVTHNDWIVVQQINPRPGYPPMEFKIQVCGNAAYADASGAAAGYKWEGTGGFRGFTIRFSPIGGWDLADVDPDFADPMKASDNRAPDWAHGGSGNDGRWFWVMDDDYILGLGWNIVTGSFINIPFYIGEYNAKSVAQDTIAAPPNLIISDDVQGLVQTRDSAVSSFQAESATSGQPVGCLDENGVFQDWPYSCGRMEGFLPGGSQPNEFDSTLGLDLMEIPIRTYTGGTPTGPDSRVIGTLKHVWRGFTIGDGARFDTSQKMGCSPDYGLITEWDGSTAI